MQKHPPKGDWRKFDEVEIKTTTLVQKWTNKENKKTYEARYISPWGTKNAMKQKLISDVCKTSPPTEVLPALEIDEKFDKNKIQIDVNNTGLCGKSKFQRAYCNQSVYTCTSFTKKEI